MRNTLITMAACIAIAVAGLADAKAPNAPAPLRLTLSGEGKWAVHCMIEHANGVIDRQEFNGGKAEPTVFTGGNLSLAVCDYKAADKPLTVAVEGDGWSCPLRSEGAAKCEQAFAPGARGSIRLTRTTAR